MKSLWEDPETKRRAVVSCIEGGAQLPRHRHVGNELLYVVEGAIADDLGIVTAGNMGYRPNGCIHTVSTKNGATVFAVIRRGRRSRGGSGRRRYGHRGRWRGGGGGGVGGDHRPFVAEHPVEEETPG
ncbi:MAG: hypothetical protein DMD91_34300 [Candidatus Rokuibacteriota bacterium]|nr:MAG: hypothetical protein DMD91_34300 [Candidatus Rokubacteria bacterium]